ncbi:MAG: hypothetical protein U9R79_07695 [Armatimonadota bacterium]|nr:hypothetical protein [Armatimonadota bacterium]
MANALFDYGRDEFLKGNIDWINDTINVILVDEGDDVPDPATDQNLEDILAAARVATGTLDNTAAPTTDGVADADDEVLSAVSGDESESLVIYKDTGAEATSTLIAYIDTAGGTLPVTPNGGDITIEWDSGANRIFKL